MEKQCLNCHHQFEIKRNPNQCYCSKQACQRARKRQWQQQKLAEDNDYKVNQRQAAKDWRYRNPHYWKTYRAQHPDYTERNRQRSRLRWQARDGNKVNGSMQHFAKMDALNSPQPLQTGRYQLMPVKASDFAKMDALTVEITVIPRACAA